MESNTNLTDIERLSSTLLELELHNNCNRVSLSSTNRSFGSRNKNYEVSLSDVRIIEQMSNLKDLAFYEDNWGPKMSLKKVTNLENIASKIEADINEIALCKT